MKEISSMLYARTSFRPWFFYCNYAYLSLLFLRDLCNDLLLSVVTWGQLYASCMVYGAMLFVSQEGTCAVTAAYCSSHGVSYVGVYFLDHLEA